MALRRRIDERRESEDAAIAMPARRLYAVPAAREEPAFTALERNVILLARNDTLASLEAPGPIERALAWIFGTRAQAKRLADDRLEALRGAVVVTRARRHLPDRIAAELRKFGYGERRIAALETLALAS